MESEMMATFPTMWVDYESTMVSYTFDQTLATIGPLELYLAAPFVHFGPLPHKGLHCYHRPI